MKLIVRQSAGDGRDLDAFCNVVDLVYKSVSQSIRPSRKALQSALQQRDHNGRQQIFVAEKDGLAVAHVLARLSKTSDQANHWATLGHFESINDQRTATFLLCQAVQWLRARGVHEVIGPIDRDTWHRYRFTTGPYDERPFLMEPYNPSYYPSLWETAGFELLETYHSKRLDDVTRVAENFTPIYDRVRQRGYTLESLDLRRFDQELDRLYKLSLVIFAENKLYTDISRDEFGALYQSAKPLIDPQLVWFAKSPGGEDIGFVFAIRDYHAAMVTMQGKSNLLARIRFWMNKGRSETINVKSMGVVPGHRRSGVGVALVCEVYRRMLAMGYRRANLCLIHDENPSSRLDGGLGRVFRRYCLYRHAGIT